jgi:hypothetical protein
MPIFSVVNPPAKAYAVARQIDVVSPEEANLKVLGAQRPTPEQLKIIGDTRIGTEIIRGAAGSGKTTTALLRLRNLSDMFKARHTRLGIAHPVRALLLTYNRTLCGYVEALAEEQAAKGGGVAIEVTSQNGLSLRIFGPRSSEKRFSKLPKEQPPLIEASRLLPSLPRQLKRGASDL